METTIIHWGYMGIMEKKMETTIMENHMEKKLKMKWKLGLYRGL